LKKIDLFIFIDSYGFELLKKTGSLHSKLTYQKPVRMQFGYSSTAIPSILTGKSPSTHKQFTFFYHLKNNSTSMFSFFDSWIFKIIPDFISKRRRFRVLLSKVFKNFFNISGYFDLYAVPFSKLKYFHYSEMKDLFSSNAFENCENLKDVLLRKKIKHFISDWRLSEDENFSELFREIKKQENEFIFAYFAGLDGVQHMHTKDSSEALDKVAYYKENLDKVFDLLEQNHEDYRVGIFSDHGMTTLSKVVDIQKALKETSLDEGKDYLSFLDSTMARFWYYSDNAQEVIRKKLSELPYGKILSNDELKKMGILFEDQRYGEDIFLVDPGVQIAPSDMGKDALPGMHGYTPDDKDSDAIWLSNYTPEKPPVEVKDIFECMLERVKGS
tara:strand:+ start:6668 stop:7822 length:1155 start_codon:yes stop_codon:yes gene_type:complete